MANDAATDVPPEQPVFTLSKDRADALHEQARAALASSAPSGSERLLIEALRLHPALDGLYRTLGETLAAMGDEAGARACRASTVPEDCLARYGIATAASPDGAAEPARDVRRIECLPGRPFELRAALSCAPLGTEKFEPHTRKSSSAFVDAIDGGRFWFDGLNRVVLDGQGGIIDAHSRGTPALIADITRHHAPAHIEGRLFAITNRGFNNYYHWMVDILPSFGLAARAGFAFGPDDRILVVDAASRFQASTLERIGVSPRQIVTVHRGGTPWVSADELIVPHFVNSFGLTVDDWIPAFLRSTFVTGAKVGTEGREEAPADAASGRRGDGSRLYFARAANARNGRAIDNEREMMERLFARGFTVLYPEHYSVSEQADLCATAEVVMAAHGASLTNIVFCRPDTRIIEIYGDYIESCYWGISNACGLRYFALSCGRAGAEASATSPEPAGSALRKADLRVDLDRLEELLDLAGVD